jgi:ribonuclease P protein component
MNQTLGKEYKLCSQKIIQQIFEEKRSVKQFPFVINYCFVELPTEKSFQIVIAAPKRIFRKAHDRNRIKRLCRETIRKNKYLLEEYLSAANKQIALFFVYTNKEEMVYDVLLKKTESLFKKLIIELSKLDA